MFNKNPYQWGFFLSLFYRYFLSATFRELAESTKNTEIDDKVVDFLDGLAGIPVKPKQK